MGIDTFPKARFRRALSLCEHNARRCCSSCKGASTTSIRYAGSLHQAPGLTQSPLPLPHCGQGRNGVWLESKWHVGLHLEIGLACCQSGRGRSKSARTLIGPLSGHVVQGGSPQDSGNGVGGRRPSRPLGRYGGGAGISYQGPVNSGSCGRGIDPPEVRATLVRSRLPTCRSRRRLATYRTDVIAEASASANKRPLGQDTPCDHPARNGASSTGKGHG